VEMRVSNTRNIPCRFDISRDNLLLCSGNGEGVVSVYRMADGKLLRKFEHKRSRTAIKSCAFSKDARFVMFYTFHSFTNSLSVTLYLEQVILIFGDMILLTPPLLQLTKLSFKRIPW
jgi:hypothetical protein